MACGQGGTILGENQPVGKIAIMGEEGSHPHVWNPPVAIEESHLWGMQPTSEVVIQSTWVRTHSLSVSKVRREGTLPTGEQPLPRSQARAHLRVQEGRSMQRDDVYTKHPTASFPYSKIPPERPVEHSRCPDP